MLSLAMDEWVREFGWTRASISTVMTVTLVFMAALAPMVGYAIDRSGPRAILAGGVLMVGASSAVLAGMDSMLAFIIGFALLGSLGFGLVATHAVSSAVARSFDAGQGRAVGIATSGSTAGQFVFMPLLGLVLAGGGWRLGYQALAIACVIVAILAWWLLRHAAASVRSRATHDPQESFLARVGYLLRRPAFHGLFWSFLLCGYTSTGVVETHLIPFAQFCGIPPAPSALAFGILMGVNTLGMIAAGYLTDRMNRTVLLASIYVFRSLIFLMLPLLIQETAILWIFAFLFGAFDYATVPPTASLAASHLGKARVGTAMGLISAGHSIGAAMGAFAGGYLFDLTGGYTWLWSSSFGLALAAGMIAGLVPARSRAAAAMA
jgi:MFS family permease